MGTSLGLGYLAGLATPLVLCIAALWKGLLRSLDECSTLQESWEEEKSPDFIRFYFF